MVSLAGMSWSFDRAQEHLWEFCHVRVSDDTIERVCQEQGRQMEQWMRESQVPVKAFGQAAGREEFSTDGVKINTVDGWREMRISVLARREVGRPCEPQEWDQRVLPEPTVRLASCAIAPAHRVGARWARLARRVGLKHSTTLSVVADGAPWIWDQAAKRLSSQAQWCVDVYHVSEHLHACGKALHGEGPQARAWAQTHLMEALRHNGVGLIQRLQQERGDLKTPAAQEAVDRLLGYLEPNRDSLWYRRRLAEGLPIGSGLIEGACKNMIGQRLKANSARWRVRRAERIAALRAVDYSALWNDYWSQAA
jgi:hypothetical protein